MKLGKEKTIMIGGAILVGVVLFFIIFVRPLLNKIRSMHKELNIIEQELRPARDIVRSKDGFEKISHLLSRDEISLAIDEITKTGKALNINFISMSPQEIEWVRGTAYSFLPINMDLESEYKDVGLFFGALEKFKKSVVTLRSFMIKRDENISPLTKSKIVLDMYVKGENGKR